MGKYNHNQNVTYLITFIECVILLYLCVTCYYL